MARTSNVFRGRGAQYLRGARLGGGRNENLYPTPVLEIIQCFKRIGPAMIADRMVYD